MCAALAVLLVATLLTSVQTSPAQAADARNFNPGNIISDANFYNTTSMTAADVQTFLNDKGSRCRTNCLKDYAMATIAKSAEAGLCQGYAGGQWQSAAQIIDGVARSCGISQKVLLVLLEKEQSLVSIDNPSERRYRSATGQGCPDTAPCDAAYYGLFNQLYGAARQFKVYLKYASTYWYKAGMVNSILYSPNQSCGRKSVYIENQATAALYIYTPYTPNDAALRAQWGEGDGCSSYGNRNFYMFWSTWFGDPLVAGPEADIAATRAQYPSLGDQTTNVECGQPGGGCRQLFANGAIFWNSKYGARKVDGGIWGLYQNSGQVSGYLGYPTDTATWSTVNNGGWIQNFELGAIYWSSVAGGRIVSSSIFQQYSAAGGPAGGLGWPMTDQNCGQVRGGCIQTFQFGNAYWSAGGGTWIVGGGIKETFDSMGGLAGVLGYPVGPQQYRAGNGGGWVQGFEGGAIYWRNGWGIHMFGGIRDEYARNGYSDGSLGWPISVQTCSASGCRQDFQNGSILWTAAAGAFTVDGAVATAYANSGMETGALGYPVSNTFARSGNGDGRVQAFQSGAVYIKSGRDPIVMSGAIREEYGRQNYNWGVLGWPTTAQKCGLAGGACSQDFDGGSIYWTPANGAATVSGAFKTAFDAKGGSTGSLGYPISAITPREGNGSGFVQAYTGGAIYVKNDRAAVISGAIRDEYGRQNYSWGTLGWPRADQVCGLAAGGCKQEFETGWITWSPTAGARRIDGGLWETWVAQGAESGPLGYPTSAAYPRNGGGWSQDFEHGKISWTGARGGFLE
ncbi:hypothetical protein [Microbacterium binotii]|uniref:LGFP repeat-containing protein n=1 Tax=Microbacterium binotii TaxID=462710 RepID=A0ABN3P5M9_9MICO